MLSFATEFPVDNTKGLNDFMEVVVKWIVFSPHNKFSIDDFTGVKENLVGTVKKDNDAAEFLFVEDEGCKSLAIRYINITDDIQWTTEIVYSKGLLDGYVGIRVSRESDRPIDTLPVARKPVLVQLILEEMGGGNDGNRRVGSMPHYFDESEVEMVASLMKGINERRLPVVFLSCPFRGIHYVNCNALASDLAGMAHVVIEPSRAFSRRLKIEMDGDNVFGGIIGLYWPESGAESRYEFLRNVKKHEIVEKVRQSLLYRKPLSRCNWNKIEQVSARLSYEHLKESRSVSVEDYVEAFDTELRGIKAELEEEKMENTRLKRELKISQAKNSSRAGVTFKTGQEQEYYEGELYEIALDAICSSVNQTQEGGRRRHILEAIARSNDSRSILSENREKLKGLLRDYRSMNGKLKGELEDLGFSISEDGKHYKAIYMGDDRYVFILPKTGSDHRGGLNVVSDIAKRIF